MEKKKGFEPLFIVMIVSFITVICIATFFALSQYVQDYNNQLQYQNNGQQQNTQTQTDSTAGWQTYADNQYGFTFKYPSDLGSKYASLNAPTAFVVSDSSNIKANGCLISQNPMLRESQVTINNMQFCLGVASDPGAGQLYNTYNYTTSKNGNYITLQYVVHTLNGCSPYMDTPDYRPCTDFMNNYDNLVAKPIEDSVATLTFTK